MLDSKIVLGSSSSSSITYEVTLYNNTDKDYVFIGVITDTTDETLYSNTNITYSVNMEEYEKIIAPKESLTFEVTFSYAGTDVSNTTLESKLNFRFREKPIITLSNEDETYTLEDIYPGCEEQEYEFTVANYETDTEINGVPMTYTFETIMETGSPLTAKIYDEAGNEVTGSIALEDDGVTKTNTTYTLKISWDETNNSEEYTNQEYTCNVKLKAFPEDETYAEYKETKEFNVGIATAPLYTITYELEGGTWPDGTTTSKTQTKTYGVTLTLLSDTPTRTGYDFQGWGVTNSEVSYQPSDEFEINESTMLYAVWEPKTYTITFKHYLADLSGSTYTLKSTTTQAIDYGTTITLSSYTTTVTGGTYSFASSTASTSGGTAITSKEITGSTTIGMYYTRKSYTVTFKHYLADSNGSTYTLQTTKYYAITYGRTITLSNYTTTVSGGTYSFASSTASTSGGTAITSITITGSRTIGMYYTRNSYTVTFKHYLEDLSGSTYTLTTTTTQTIDEGTTITLSSYTTTVTGGTYSFASSTASTSGGTAITTKEITGSTTIGMYYTRKSYTVTLKHYLEDLSGSTYTLKSTTTQTVTHGATITLADCTTTITGGTYSYASVTASTSGGTNKLLTHSISQAYTFGMYYTRNSYTVTFKHYLEDLSGSTYTLQTTTTQSIVYGTTITLSSYKTSITGGTYSFASSTASTSGGTAITTKEITGATTIGMYYTRNTYTVTLTRGTGVYGLIAKWDGSSQYSVSYDVSKSFEMKYGETYNINVYLDLDTEFVSWTYTGTSTVFSTSEFVSGIVQPAHDLSLTANAQPSS